MSNDKIEKSELVEILKQTVVEVIFEKKDGTMRHMECTLDPAYFPEKNEETRTRKENENVLSVWDVEKNGWRSFRMDSIKQVIF